MSELPETRKVLRYFDDFPKKGIRFVDVNPIMEVPAAREEVLGALLARYKGMELDAVAGLEARGYFFGIPLAVALRLPFIPVRKPGKLPGETVAVEYAKEYGTDKLCAQRGAFRPGMRVLVVDDLLATGGTLAAACELVHTCGATVVEALCIIELAFLHGRDKLPKNVPFHSLLVE